MEITTITIILSAVTLFLAIVSPLFNALFRAPKSETIDTEADEQTPTLEEQKNTSKPISIVIVAHDNAPELEKSLPIFLSQAYNADYEVIVVADKSDSETDDVIKRNSHHEHLYATFMPLSSRYISRRKLAITLGIKAAKHPWIIVTDAWCRPNDERWLAAFAAHCQDDKDIVMGYTHFDEDAPARYKYEHAVHAAYNCRSAIRGRGITTNSPLVAIRKERFLEEDGFLGNLKFVSAEYAFLVNKYSTPDNTAVALNPASHLFEQTPLKKRWTNNHLFAINAQSSLSGFMRLKALYCLDNDLMHLCNISIIAGIIYGAIVQDWITLGTSILAFIIEFALRAILSRRALKTFRAPIPCLLVPLLDFTQPLCDALWRIKHCFADKYDFITHKI